MTKNNYIYHHGIKGQRWGIRRFQNEDGSLTSSGKARYNQDGTKKNAIDMDDEDLNKFFIPQIPNKKFFNILFPSSVWFTSG